MAVLLGIPTFASVLVLWSNFGPAIAAIPRLVVAFGAYALFNLEQRVSLDERGLRFLAGTGFVQPSWEVTIHPTPRMRVSSLR